MNAVAERNEMAMSLQHCQLDLSMKKAKGGGWVTRGAGGRTLTTNGGHSRLFIKRARAHRKESSNEGHGILYGLGGGTEAGANPYVAPLFPLCMLKQLFLPAIYPVRSDVAASIHHSCSALSKLLDAMPGFEDNTRANVLAFEIIE